MPVKERPILFSGPMVRAILDGRKTQTRRVIRDGHAPVAVEPYDTPGVTIFRENGQALREWYVLSPTASAELQWRRPGTELRPTKARLRMAREWHARDAARGKQTKWCIDEVAGLCPYGWRGDRLWVRETFGRCDRDNLIYKADDIDALAKEREWVSWPTWKPGIFMPRSASRITLEIADVRVQRLQDIDGRDVLAEGIDNGKSNPAQGKRWENMQRMAFGALWDSINGKRAAWASNPWVWALAFKRMP